ncbi:MAG: hypothetical protein QXR93_05975 [Archaeoglobaceae archaeon]
MDDMIDFACSSDWLDFYHERGLTPRSSGRKSREYVELLKRIEVLERQNAELLRLLRREMSFKGSNKSERAREPQWLMRGGESAD